MVGNIDIQPWHMCQRCCSLHLSAVRCLVLLTGCRAACRCITAMPPQQADAFLGAATTWLDHPDAPVQVGAIKAVSALADNLGATVLRPHLPRLYQGASAWRWRYFSSPAPVQLTVQPGVVVGVTYRRMGLCSAPAED